MAKKQRKPTLEIYRNQVKEWRWRLVAPNGQIVASGEGYRNKAGMLRTTGKYLAAHEVVELDHWI